MRPLRAAAAAAALAAAAVACSASPPRPAARAPLPARPMSYLGVYAPGVPASAAPVAAFSAATGARVNIAAYYSGWGEPFKAAFAAALERHGVTTVVQVDPDKVSLAAIAAGSYDAYLRSYADSVRDFRHPVVISFGHEMNGGWYSWGNGRTPAAAFVAAWRHVVSAFRAEGAGNVTWMWTVNAIAGSGGGIGNPALWWPGAAYVTWVGVDGYFWYQQQDFQALFAPTLKALRAFTSDPVLIAETGINASLQQAPKIPGLFAGAAKAGVLGFIWFDDDKAAARGTPHDWRLTSPAALAAFRAAVRQYGQ